MATHTQKCTKTQEGTLLSFLASFCLCFSVCVLSLLQCCVVLFIQLFLGEWSSMLVSPPPPVLSPGHIQRSAERNCSSHAYSTQLFHNDKLAPPLPDSLLLLSLSLFLSLTLPPQSSQHFTPLYLHLSLLDIVCPLLLPLFLMHSLVFVNLYYLILIRHHLGWLWFRSIDMKPKG